MVLRVRPLEAEAELAFAGLFDLVRPVEHLLDQLPERQRAALAGALALGPPAPDDRFAVAGRDAQPARRPRPTEPRCSAIVDDAHWLDTPSREALLFAGSSAGRRRRRAAVRDARTRVVTRGAGSDAGAARAAPGRRRGADRRAPASAVDARRPASRWSTETRGNPLAMLEAIETLQRRHELRRHDTDRRARSPSATRSSARSRCTSTELPADTRRALLIAAASKTGATGEIVDALAADRARRGALEPAERHRPDHGRRPGRLPPPTDPLGGLSPPGPRRAARSAPRSRARRTDR